MGCQFSGRWRITTIGNTSGSLQLFKQPVSLDPTSPWLLTLQSSITHLMGAADGECATKLEGRGRPRSRIDVSDFRGVKSMPGPMRRVGEQRCW